MFLFLYDDACVVNVSSLVIVYDRVLLWCVSVFDDVFTCPSMMCISNGDVDSLEYRRQEITMVIYRVLHKGSSSLPHKLSFYNLTYKIFVGETLRSDVDQVLLMYRRIITFKFTEPFCNIRIMFVFVTLDNYEIFVSYPEFC